MVGDLPSSGIIHSIGLHGLYQTLTTGGGTPASAAWPTAAKAFYIPFVVTEPTTFDRAFVANGAVATGDIDIGIFTTPGFVKIASTGAFNQVGTGAVQFANLAVEVYLKRGIYLMGISLSSATGTTLRINVGTDPGLTNSIGVKEETSAHPLPATATPVQTANGYLPLFGFLAKGAY